VSVIPFAMSTEKQTQEKEKNKNESEDMRETEKTINQLGSHALNKIVELSKKISNFNEWLESTVNNPWVEKIDNAMVHISINLDDPIEIPPYISFYIFNNQVVITGIEIYGSQIELKYVLKETLKSNVKRNDYFTYLIEMDYSRMAIKDLYLALFVLSRLPYNPLGEFIMSINAYMQGIENEKNNALKVLIDNGIQIEN